MASLDDAIYPSVRRPVNGIEIARIGSTLGPSIEAAIERFRATIARLDFAHAGDTDVAESQLRDAAVAIVRGADLDTTTRAFSDRLEIVANGDPVVERIVLRESMPVFVAAAIQTLAASDGEIRTAALHDALDPVSASIETDRDQVPDWLTANPAMLALFDTETVGACLTTDDGTVIQVNQRFLNIFGVFGEDLIGSPGATLLPQMASFTEGQLGVLAEHLDGAVPRIAFESLVTRPDGSTAWIAGDSMRIQGTGNGAAFYLSFVEDITDRKASHRMRRDSEERFQALVQNLSDVIGVLSRRGQLDYVTDSIQRVLGHDPASLLGRDVLESVAVEDRTSVRDVFDQVLTSPLLHAQTTARLIHVDGSWRWMELDFTNLIDLPGIDGVLVTARDVSKRKSFEQQLERLAFHDMLTALPNRLHFRERLDAAMARPDRAEDGVAVIFLDLDRFKLINDRSGHDGGDNVLVAVAQRILDAMRPGELVARLGGDEFAILVEPATAARAMHTANKVLAAIAQEFPDQAHIYNLAATAGVAISSPQLTHPAEILRAADIALYKGKHAGGGVATLFEPGMFVEVLARAEMERDLRLALNRQEIVPWYEPAFDLRTGALCGFEVSMCWRRPGRPPAPPGVFLDLAIELGIIAPLSLSVLGAACSQLVAWSDAYPDVRGASISFNVSASEIAKPGYAGQIIAIVGKTGLDPARVEIEIEDRTFREPSPDLTRFAESLAKSGIMLVVDEFGGDYASWNQLRRWHVHHVKVACTAIAEDDDVEANVELLRGLTVRAAGSNIMVCGVRLDSSELVERAREVGCDRGQGAHLGQSLPAEDMPALLDRLLNP